MLTDTLTVTNICHEVILRSREVTYCPEHALVTNLFVAKIRRLSESDPCTVRPEDLIFRSRNEGEKSMRTKGQGRSMIDAYFESLEVTINQQTSGPTLN